MLNGWNAHEHQFLILQSTWIDKSLALAKVLFLLLCFSDVCLWYYFKDFIFKQTPFQSCIPCLDSIICASMSCLGLGALYLLYMTLHISYDLLYSNL